MTEPASLGKQKSNIELFEKQLKAGTGKEWLNEVFSKARNSHEADKGAIINGKKLIEYEEFKLLYPIFLKIYKDHFDEMELVRAMKLDPLEAARGFSTTEKLGLDLAALAKNESIMRKMTESMSFSNEEVNKIIRGLEEYERNKRAILSMTDLVAKKTFALNLYKDAYEVYLKILKELYSKVKKIPVSDVHNDLLYDFLDRQYPQLRKDADNHLRNDSGHLNFDERDKYTVEQLLELSDRLRIEAITALIAKNEFILSHFESWLSKVFQSWDLKKISFLLK